MSVYVAMHGGASYSMEDVATEYRSLKEARREYINRRTDSYYPCWGERFTFDREYVAYAYTTIPNGAFADINGPLDCADVYPDYVLVLGPRGGLYWEQA